MCVYLDAISAAQLGTMRTHDCVCNFSKTYETSEYVIQTSPMIFWCSIIYIAVRFSPSDWVIWRIAGISFIQIWLVSNSIRILWSTAIRWTTNQWQIFILTQKASSAKDSNSCLCSCLLWCEPISFECMSVSWYCPCMRQN